MKIDAVDTRVVHAAPATNWVFVEITTSDGRIGTGEATLSGNERRVADAVDGIARALRGRSAFDDFTDVVSAHADGETQLRATVRSALDTATWDLKAQAASLPLATMLGGDVSRVVPLYANINRAASDRSPEGMAALAGHAVAAGFSALKCAPFDGLTPANADEPEGKRAARLAVERLQAVRNAVGDGIDVMVDCHWRLSPARAEALLDDFSSLGLAWIEDPFPEEDVAAWRALRERTDIPLTGGERATSLAELALALQRGQYDICTPDVRHIGGVSALWHAAHMIDAHGASFAPHNPRGPIGTLASAHVAAAAPHVLAVEFPFGECAWRSDLVGGREAIANASLALPTEPGIGARIDGIVSDRHPFRPVVPPRVASDVDIW